MEVAQSRKVTWKEFKERVYAAVKKGIPYDIFERRFGKQLDKVFHKYPQTQSSITKLRQYARHKSPELTTLMRNHGNSCYKDSVIVALFYASGVKEFFLSALLEKPFVNTTDNPTDNTTDNPNTNTDEDWERTINDQWRQRLRENIKSVLEHCETSAPLNPLLSECPYVTKVNGEEHCVNFGEDQQQSAVDFMRYLFNVLKLKDKVCYHRRSTTMIQKHADIENSKLHTLCHWWNRHSSTVETFSRNTANSLPDEEDAQQLRSLPQDTILLYNHLTKDKRWISSEDTVAMFLCQLTFQDQQRRVDIARHIKPHVEKLDAEGYRGSLLAKLHVVQVVEEKSPVILFEVSRNIGPCKVLAVIDFGVKCQNGWTLTLDSTNYALRAIICHRGRQNSGHYVTFIYMDGIGWAGYDDMDGKLVAMSVEDIEQSDYPPNRTGEVFIYSLIQSESN